MKLSVERQIFTLKSTQGALSIDGLFFCYTLEPPRGAQLIPVGIYPASLDVSPKFTEHYKYDFRVPLLKNVPGHTAVEMHIGNTPRDTTACTLVGMSKSVDALESSEDAFFKLFHRLPQDFVVEYVERLP